MKAPRPPILGESISKIPPKVGGLGGQLRKPYSINCTEIYEGDPEAHKEKRTKKTL